MESFIMRGYRRMSYNAVIDSYSLNSLHIKEFYRILSHQHKFSLQLNPFVRQQRHADKHFLAIRFSPIEKRNIKYNIKKQQKDNFKPLNLIFFFIFLFFSRHNNRFLYFWKKLTVFLSKRQHKRFVSWFI